MSCLLQGRDLFGSMAEGITHTIYIILCFSSKLITFLVSSMSRHGDTLKKTLKQKIIF